MITTKRLLVVVIVLQLVLIALVVVFRLDGVALEEVRGTPEGDGQLPPAVLFQQAISAASLTDPERVMAGLFALADGNAGLEWQERDGERHVKAVAWMSGEAFDRFYQGREMIDVPPAEVTSLWVTLVPQVREFCRALGVDDATYRLKQYLGLNPERRYQHFVEFWIRPGDLFRPCPDPDPTDTVCNLDLDRLNPPRVENIDDYVLWFDGLVASSYTPTGAPWTRLGYTYDWARGEFGVGASEYIVRPETRILVEADYSTHDYCSVPIPADD